MANMPKLDAAIAAAADANHRALGAVLREIGRRSAQAAALIEQDLTNPALSLEGCFTALRDYARTHARKGEWACAVFEITPDNPVVGLCLDFYKIPPEWLSETGAPAPIPTPAPVSASGGTLDLLDLL